MGNWLAKDSEDNFAVGSESSQDDRSASEQHRRGDLTTGDDSEEDDLRSNGSCSSSYYSADSQDDGSFEMVSTSEVGPDCSSSLGPSENAIASGEEGSFSTYCLRGSKLVKQNITSRQQHNEPRMVYCGPSDQELRKMERQKDKLEDACSTKVEQHKQNRDFQLAIRQAEQEEMSGDIAQNETLLKRMKGILVDWEECFDRRKRRYIAHDGQFQAIDDVNNHDKVLQHYSSLYVEADSVSQSIEKLIGLDGDGDRESIEEEISKFLIRILLISFHQAASVLDGFVDAVWKQILLHLGTEHDRAASTSVTGRCQPQTNRKSGEAAASMNPSRAESHATLETPSTFSRAPRGLEGLLRELLRSQTVTEAPRKIFESVVERLAGDSLYECILAKQARRSHAMVTAANTSENSRSMRRARTPANTPHSKLMDFVNMCAVVAWQCQMLPMPIQIKEEDLITVPPPTFVRKFHEHHASSDRTSSVIKEVMWPALVARGEGLETRCLIKANVITGSPHGQ